MQVFKASQLANLFKPATASSKEDNGKVTIIGGSSLFHGSPLFALKTASRVVDMVFFASPEPSLGEVATKLKSKLAAFVWVPWQEVEEYIAKSDAVLIGPGLMRYRNDQNHQCRSQRICDQVGEQSKKLTHHLLQKFPAKKWVIDAGSLQVMDAGQIPAGAMITPNRREFKMLFGQAADEMAEKDLLKLAGKYQCVIVLKKAVTIVCSSKECFLIEGGNAGLTKGGTGDVLAGLAVALAAKNEPFLAACAASYLVKKAAEKLYQKAGFAYSADDLAEAVPEGLGRWWR